MRTVGAGPRLPRRAALSGFVVGLVASCSSGHLRQPEIIASSSDAGVADMPEATIRFALEDPGIDEAYPFGSGQGEPAPQIGSSVYVSAAQSSLGDGQPFEVTWSVVAPDGGQVQLTLSATSQSAAFAVSRLGEHVVSLRITGTQDAGLVADARLRLAVEAKLCAANGTDAECRQALAVPGGSFSRGSPADLGHPSERPEHTARVEAYALDRFELTVGRFREFLDTWDLSPPAEGAGAHPLIAASGWQTSWNVALPTSREQLLQAFEECRGSFSPEAQAGEAFCR